MSEEVNRGHGSPWDRGQADVWYGRQGKPHKVTDGVRTENLTPAEVIEYWGGFREARGRNEEGKSYR